MKRIIYNNETKLDIGCGKNKISNFIGMDWEDFGQEIIWDIKYGIPLPNDSLTDIHSSHFIEHLHIEDLMLFFNEIVRVSKNGCKITFICPHKDCIEAHYVCHYTLWDENKIQGICKEFKNLELVSTSRNGINIIIQLKINK